MPDVTDMELLRDYRRGSEQAFAELVQRHINLVYSTALRHAGIAAHAEEIAQAVFVVLARKAAALRPDTIVEAWLYETTRLTSLSFLRGEWRRQRREQEAYMQSILRESSGDSTWNQIAPLLDEAMARLGKKDREAVVLRFFKDKKMREVATAMDVSESAAQSRVHRALEKLRRHFYKRGVISAAAVIAGALAANSVHAAPAGLAKTISAVATAKSAAASTSTLTLVKGVLKIMAWTKAKTAIVAGAVILLAAGTATITVKQIHNSQNDALWEVENPTSDMLNTLPPLVKIVPTKFGGQNRYKMVGFSVPDLRIYRFVGIAVPVQNILEIAYEGDGNSKRILALTKISPLARYDFIVNLPSGDMEALQEEIKANLKLTAKNEMVETNVLALTVKDPGSAGLQASLSQKTIVPRAAPGEITFEDDGFKKLATSLGNPSFFKIPVMDNTSLTNKHYYDLKWEPSNSQNRNLPGLKQALLDQLGLELVPTNMPVEMLVVEKVD